MSCFSSFLPYSFPSLHDRSLRCLELTECAHHPGRWGLWSTIQTVLETGTGCSRHSNINRSGACSWKAASATVGGRRSVFLARTLMSPRGDATVKQWRKEHLGVQSRVRMGSQSPENGNHGSLWQRNEMRSNGIKMGKFWNWFLCIIPPRLKHPSALPNNSQP